MSRTGFEINNNNASVSSTIVNRSTSDFSDAISSLGVNKDSVTQGQAISPSSTDIALNLDRSKRGSKRKATVKSKKRKTPIKARSKRSRTRSIPQAKPRVSAPAPEVENQPQVQVARPQITAPAQAPIAPMGGSTNLNNILPQQQPAPVIAPAAPAKPQPKVAVSSSRLHAGSNYNRTAPNGAITQTNVSGVVATTAVEIPVGNAKITLSNSEHDNYVSNKTALTETTNTTTITNQISRSGNIRSTQTTQSKTETKVSNTNQNIHTSDYQARVDIPVAPNTNVFGAIRSSTTYLKDNGKSEYTKTNSVIRASGGVSQTIPISPNTKLVATATIARDFGGATPGSTFLEGRGELQVGLLPLQSATKLNAAVGVVSRVTATDRGDTVVGAGIYAGLSSKIPLSKSISLDLGAKVGIENGANNLPTRDFGMGGRGITAVEGEISAKVRIEI